MRPCDCVDKRSVDKLDGQFIVYNDKCIEVRPPNVILTVGACAVRIPMSVFKRFATWYLEDQS
jgi:hypothetical protein